MADLYIAPVPAGSMESLFPPQRQAQLEATKDQGHRRQRYGVWKLLEYALSQSLGLELRRLQLTLDDRGRWSCQECYFSLSHTDEAVAVAVSRQPIGIDIERLDRPLHPSLPSKILTPDQLAEYTALAEAEKQPYLLQRWCAKESLFKWQEAAQPPAPPAQTGIISIGGKAYCYAVVTQEEIKWN